MATFSGIDIRNLSQCVEDARRAIELEYEGFSFAEYRENYIGLLADLNTAKNTYPLVYQRNVIVPFIRFLEGLGEERFDRIFCPKCRLSEREKFLREIIPDISVTIVDGNNQEAVNAFQEVVSDLYDGFLSAEDRVSKSTGQPIPLPDRATLPPLVKWGNPKAGPYTWPVDATSALGLRAAIVSMPPAFSRRGLLAWTTLGHETSGHDILHANTGLLEELGQKVYRAVEKSFPGKGISGYWKSCVDETASDVLGVLNMGPAAAIGLIGYLRALSPDGKMRKVGHLSGPHPVDLLRGAIAAGMVYSLRFSESEEWGDLLFNEVLKDNDQPICLSTGSGVLCTMTKKEAFESAAIAGIKIATCKLSCLGGYCLKEIQDWTDEDEERAREIGEALIENGPLPSQFRGNHYYAAHVVAGATMEALKENAPIDYIFRRMKAFLSLMHRDNSTWNRFVPSVVPFTPSFSRRLGPQLTELNELVRVFAGS